MTKPHSRIEANLCALLRDLIETPDQPAGECAKMQANLDRYVNDELEGMDVRGRHPDLWSHLQTCPICRREHDSLVGLLVAEMHGELSALPPRPSVVHAPVDPPWRVTFEAAGRERPGLLFIFTPSYLRQSLRSAATARASRLAEPGPALDRLLVSYVDDTPAGEVMVQIHARPGAVDPAQCQLIVSVAAEPMLRGVALTWAGQTMEKMLGPDGSAQLGPAPLAPLDTGDWPADAFSLRLLT